VIGRQTHVEEGAVIDGSIVWPNGWIGPDAAIRGSILGRNCHVGRSASIESAAVLGDKTVITDYSKI
jgi:mannose-1-phosphate guanylyltransferase/phosphomannomutase